MERVSTGSKTLIAGATFALALVFGNTFAADEELGSLDPKSDQVIEAEVNADTFSSGLGAENASPYYISPYNIYSYKHYWGAYNGTVKPKLWWSVVNNYSRVFVSCSEGHLGAAKYTVHNVVPGDGYIETWVTIDWGSPIKLYCDYLVIN